MEAFETTLKKLDVLLNADETKVRKSFNIDLVNAGLEQPHLKNPELKEQVRHNHVNWFRDNVKSKYGEDYSKNPEYKKAKPDIMAKLDEINKPLKPYWNKYEKMRALAYDRCGRGSHNAREHYLNQYELLCDKHNKPHSKRQIVIYTNPKILNLKKGNDGYKDTYWTFIRPPKFMKFITEVFFAVSGEIKGSFEINKTNTNQIFWNPETWKSMKPIKVKSFRGFRYKDFEAKEMG